MDVFKKHSETFKILGGMCVGLIASCFWLSGKFEDVNQRLSVLERDMAVMKTVLIMKEVMPREFAVAKAETKEVSG